MTIKWEFKPLRDTYGDRKGFVLFNSILENLACRQTEIVKAIVAPIY